MPSLSPLATARRDALIAYSRFLSAFAETLADDIAHPDNQSENAFSDSEFRPLVRALVHNYTETQSAKLQALADSLAPRS